VARKGVDTLIQSMASLQKDFPHIKLVIAGDGPQKEELLNLSRRQKIANKCLFIGKVSETEKNWLLHNCYVFAMPNKQVGQSDVEGFGIVFLEAALHGKPVIGGNSGGVPDAISNKRTGFLVEPENDADLANLLRSILKNPDRAKKMGQKGQAWVQKNFVIDKYNPKIEKYLQQL
jgi:phosphatidylinositol alpha-1,6-mannosyltransferase